MAAVRALLILPLLLLPLLAAPPALAFAPGCPSAQLSRLARASACGPAAAARPTAIRGNTRGWGTAVGRAVSGLQCMGKDSAVPETRASEQAQRAGAVVSRRSALLGLPMLLLSWFSGLGSASAEATGEAALKYDRWWVLPIAPFERRRTVRTELVPGEIWGFDQLLGALYVQVPLRMTVVRLAPADAPPSLLVFAPISPTEECLRLVRELEAQHGPVRNIVLSSPAIEHKVAAGPFARNFPEAQLWVAPDQYSFPPGLDNLGLLGATQLFWGLRPRPLPPSAAGTPWVGEMEHALLGPLRSRGGDAPGLFEDVAMVHRRSRTLLVTDLVQTVPREIPAVLADDPRALLFHARDDAFARVEDSPATRQRGWERIALFSLFFQPGGVDVVPWAQAIPDAARSQMGELGWGGLFPFTWRPRAGPHPPEKAYYKESFEALAGECFVPAVLQSLILDREPARVLAFADAVARWDFAQIVPAHLGAPIPAGPREWRRAFAFLEDGDAEFPGDLERPPLAGDARFLRDISQSLADKAPPPPPPPAAPGARAEAARARRGWSRRRTRRSRLRGSAAACAAAYRLGVALWNTQPALDSPQPTPQVLTRGVRAGRPHRAPATAGGRSVTSR